MAPYISVSERKAASLMTWTMLVAHVRAVEQCDEREARRQIGNIIAVSGPRERGLRRPGDARAISASATASSAGSGHFSSATSFRNSGALIVERWSARRWMARILITWGLVTVLVSPCIHRGSFIWRAFCSAWPKRAFSRASSSTSRTGSATKIAPRPAPCSWPRFPCPASSARRFPDGF